MNQLGSGGLVVLVYVRHLHSFTAWRSGVMRTSLSAGRSPRRLVLSLSPYQHITVIGSLAYEHPRIGRGRNSELARNPAFAGSRGEQPDSSVAEAPSE